MASMAWDGEEYQARFDRLARGGVDVHGEAAFVMAYAPRSVLDAGCGTGQRYAIELARLGVEVVGTDLDGSMLATARRLQPSIEFVESDLAELRLDRTFDVVLMAGNVLLFTPAGTEAAVVAGCARHLAATGRLISGFSLDRGYGARDYDAHSAAAGLELEARFATWDGDPLGAGSGADYAVSVHRRAAP